MNWTFEIPLCLSSDMNNKQTFAPTVSSVKGYVLYFSLFFFFLNWYFWNILVWARMGQKLARCLERHMEPCSSCAALHWGLPTIIQVTLASLVDILTIFWAFCCFFYKKKKFISCKCTSFNSKIKFEKWMQRNISQKQRKCIITSQVLYTEPYRMWNEHCNSLQGTQNLVSVCLLTNIPYT